MKSFLIYSIYYNFEDIDYIRIYYDFVYFIIITFIYSFVNIEPRYNSLGSSFTILIFTNR